jgi:GNAT superfamily N-acetyltransferase
VIADLDREQILHEAIVRPLAARVPIPGQRVVDRPGFFQLLTPAFRDGGLNEVSHVQLADDEADAVIDATLAEYAAEGIRFKWVVSPVVSAPRPRAAARQARHARAPLRRHGRRHRRPLPDPSPDVTVERVEDRAVDAYADVVAAGWGTPARPLADYQRLVLADPGDRHHSYLARVDGVPVGAANHVLFDRSAYLMGGVVLPAWRGRGAYRSLIAARLAQISGAGVRLVTIQAIAETSAPILTRLGFTPIAELDVFLNR